MGKRIHNHSFSHMDDLDLTTLPPFVYQLMLLARRGETRVVIEGLCSKLVLMDEESSKEDAKISQKQMALAFGTILLHITFVMKSDQVRRVRVCACILIDLP